MPKLSVVIAAYNEQEHLPEQLNALAKQCDWVHDVVLVDDGSTDGTLDLMTCWQDAYLPYFQRVYVVELAENVGCARATNLGVAERLGDWVYVASANDVLLPGGLEALHDAVLYNPYACVVTGDVEGVHLGWGSQVGHPEYLAPAYVAGLLGRRGILHAAGTAIRGSTWDLLGGWDPGSWPYSETLTWHVAATQYGVTYTPRPVARVRQHGGAGSVCLDPVLRRPLMERAAELVAQLPEPGRSRLARSGLWKIREWYPDMETLLKPLLMDLGRHSEPVAATPRSRDDVLWTRMT